MTISEVLQNAYKKVGKDKNKRLELELLLAFVLKTDRAYLFMNLRKEISAAEIKKFDQLTKKLFANWPLAYLTGERNFYDRPFLVNASTLIPRPESEMIIDLLKEEVGNCEKATLVDVGTGSGCLIISLAAEIGKDFKYYGLDNSRKALLVAEQNAKKIGVKINFRDSDLLSNLPEMHGKVFLIANLPYLTPEQFRNEASIKKEPKSALVSGKDGFKHYRNLFKQITKRKDLKNFFLIIEIDPRQKKLAIQEITKYFPGKTVKIYKDFRQKDRFAVVNNLKTRSEIRVVAVL